MIQDTGEQPDEEIQKASCGRSLTAGASVLAELGCTNLSAWGCVHQLGRTLNSTLGIFMDASSRGPYLSWTQSAAHLPVQSVDGEAESSKLLTMAWSFWCSAPILKPPRTPPGVTSLEQNTPLSPRKFQGI